MPTVRNHNRPMVVEVTPDDVAPSSSAPSSPSKNVRFPVPSDEIAGVSRPLTETEAWSLYHFERHARSCRLCRSSEDVLCPTGQDFAKDVSMHVYHRAGQVYSRCREDSRDIRVEVPHGYDRLLALLRAKDHRDRKPRTVPIITYDPRALPSYTTAPAVQDPVSNYYYAAPRAEVLVHRSDAHSPRRRHSTKSPRYNTVLVGEDDDDLYDKPRSSKEEKRGSLYKEEPKRKTYRVQVREPVRESSDTRRHRSREEKYRN